MYVSHAFRTWNSAYDLGDLVREEDEGPGEDGVRLLEALEGEGRYDAEVGTRAADGPEEVGFRGLGGCDLLAGCEDNFDGFEHVYPSRQNFSI